MDPFTTPRPPTPRTLRQFAALGLLGLGALALRCGLASGRAAGLLLAALALAVGVAGLVRPAWLRPVFVALGAATRPVGWVVSNLLLAVVYYALFTPVALAFRLLGRDALERRFRPDRQSYWEPRPRPAEAARYFRPF